MPTVLIGPGPLRNQPGRFREILEGAGFTTIDPPGDHTLTEPELRSALPGVDAMIAGGEVMTAELIALAPQLRAIARTGVGYDAIDVPAATARKIPVAIVPGTNHESVAEQVFALLLAVARSVVINDRDVRAGLWKRPLVQPLRGKTLGLVGLGRIGRAVALRAIAFGMTVVAFDTLADAEFDARHGIRRLPLADLLAESDVVSLHAPLTDQTRGMIDARALTRMKPGAFLINTARGGLVVEADLVESLRSGHLAGAGLDVFEAEPPDPANPLFALPNVVVSAHIAGIDVKAMADMANLAAQCVVDLYRGRWPTGCIVNEELAAGWRW